MEMKTTISLNLCELYEILIQEYGSVEAIVEECQAESDLEFARVYVGSYFCDSYFLRTIEHALYQLEQFAIHKKIRVTMVVPILMQKHVQVGLKIIDKVLHNFSIIDEVVVNDYGMLNYLSSNYDCGIIIGRLLRKRARDYRYPNYINSVEFEETKDIYLKYPRVFGADIDVASTIIDCSGYDSRIVPCIHIPYTYITCGQICDFAALDADIFQKFNDNKNCNFSCNRLYYAYKTETDHDLFRIGKAIYYKSVQYEILNTDNVRYVYFPFELWEKRYEYFGSDK